MNEWRVRPAKQSDETAIKGLWSYCFASDGETFVRWYFSRYFDHTEAIVAENSQGEIVGSAQLIRQTLETKKGRMLIRYVVGINSFPEARGRGVVAAMMDWMLQQSDVPLLFLMPFEAGFYYPYGFVFGDMHSRLKLPIEELRTLARKSGSFQRLSTETVREGAHLNDLYERWQEKYFDVYLKRTSRRWSAIIDDLALEGGHVALSYDASGSPSGYVLYRILDGAFAVRELAYVDEAARAALYYYIFAHRSQCMRLEWSAPLAEPLNWMRTANKDGAALFPFMMMRLLDPACIDHFSVKTPERLISWTVTDAYAEATHAFKWGPETAGIEPVKDLKCPDFEWTVEALTSFLFSSLPSQVVLETAKVASGSEESLEMFVSCFRRMDTYFNEYF